MGCYSSEELSRLNREIMFLQHKIERCCIQSEEYPPMPPEDNLTYVIKNKEWVLLQNAPTTTEDYWEVDLLEGKSLVVYNSVKIKIDATDVQEQTSNGASITIKVNGSFYVYGSPIYPDSKIDIYSNKNSFWKIKIQNI